MSLKVAGARRGFTVVELAIAAVMVGVLALIAIPNFLEARVRSKVSRCKVDLRRQAIALEAYFVDHRVYTRDSAPDLDASVGAAVPLQRRANGALQLTTPVAYLTEVLPDPFGSNAQTGERSGGYCIGSGTWSYAQATDGGTDEQHAAAIFAAAGAQASFVIIGVGPDAARCRVGYKSFPYMPLIAGSEGPATTASTDPIQDDQPGCYTDYDPSNGTLSVGDLYQLGGLYTDGRWCRNGEAIGSPDHLVSIPGSW